MVSPSITIPLAIYVSVEVRIESWAYPDHDRNRNMTGIKYLFNIKYDISTIMPSLKNLRKLRKEGCLKNNRDSVTKKGNRPVTLFCYRIILL
jgi:hypothetical protein